MEKIYFQKYGIDTSCEIASIFELSDSEKINAIKMLLDNIKEWWSSYFGCRQEELEYNKLLEVINKLEELEKMRKEYYEEFEKGQIKWN